MPERTPAQLGYRFPAEWEPHAATWVTWPHRHKTWPGKFEPIPALWTQMIRLLAQYEPVHVLAGGAAVRDEAERMLDGAGNVTLHDIVTNDAWTRDHGPTFLVGPTGGQQALVDWEFNAWGRKYPAFDDDNRVPQQIAVYRNCHRFQPGIILEGGSLDSDGEGTILTTEQCLLNPNRNPGLGRDDLERTLVDYVGAKKVLWLSHGIVGDDTDGHVDQLARFVGPATVVTALESDPTDANYAALHENFVRLSAMTDAQGRRLEVIPLPMPKPVYYGPTRLPASYANFYVINGLVLVPQFDDPAADAAAIALLRGIFPGREVVGQRAVDLILGRGAFHCATQQEPQQP